MINIPSSFAGERQRSTDPLRAPKRLGGFPMSVSSGQPNVSQVSVTEIAQLIARSAAAQPDGETVSKLG
jgi:hypothetical protein